MISVMADFIRDKQFICRSFLFILNAECYQIQKQVLIPRVTAFACTESEQ